MTWPLCCHKAQRRNSFEPDAGDLGAGNPAGAGRGGSAGDGPGLSRTGMLYRRVQGAERLAVRVQGDVGEPHIPGLRGSIPVGHIHLTSARRAAKRHPLDLDDLGSVVRDHERSRTAGAVDVRSHNGWNEPLRKAVLESGPSAKARHR